MRAASLLIVCAALVGCEGEGGDVHEPRVLSVEHPGDAGNGEGSATPAGPALEPEVALADPPPDAFSAGVGEDRGGDVFAGGDAQFARLQLALARVAAGPLVESALKRGGTVAVCTAPARYQDGQFSAPTLQPAVEGFGLAEDALSSEGLLIVAVPISAGRATLVPADQAVKPLEVEWPAGKRGQSVRCLVE